MERERTGPASQTRTPRGPSPSELGPLIDAARSMGDGTFSWPVAAACVSSGVLATLGRSREESDGT